MGLSRPMTALSLEFLPAMSDIALGCIDRLEVLAGARYRYAVTLGVRLTLLPPQGEAADAMRCVAGWLRPCRPTGPRATCTSGQTDIPA
jgi:hypothetical protein